MHGSNRFDVLLERPENGSVKQLAKLPFLNGKSFNVKEKKESFHALLVLTKWTSGKSSAIERHYGKVTFS